MDERICGNCAHGYFNGSIAQTEGECRLDPPSIVGDDDFPAYVKILRSSKACSHYRPRKLCEDM